MTHEEEAAAIAEISLKAAQTVANDAKVAMEAEQHLMSLGASCRADLDAAILKFKLAMFEVDKAQIALDAARSRVPCSPPTK